MKRSFLIVFLLTGALLGAPASAGVIDDAVGGLAESIVKVYGDIARERIVLYAVCAA